MIDIERAISLYQLTLYHLRNSTTSTNKNLINDEVTTEDSPNKNEERSNSRLSNISRVPSYQTEGIVILLDYIIY